MGGVSIHCVRYWSGPVADAVEAGVGRECVSL